MNIKEYCKSIKISVSEFARRLDLHPNYMWLIVSGLRNPSEALAHDIVKMSEGKINFDEIRHSKKERETCPCCGRKKNK